MSEDRPKQIALGFLSTAALRFLATRTNILFGGRRYPFVNIGVYACSSAHWESFRCGAIVICKSAGCRFAFI